MFLDVRSSMIASARMLTDEKVAKKKGLGIAKEARLEVFAVHGGEVIRHGERSDPNRLEEGGKWLAGRLRNYKKVLKAGLGSENLWKIGDMMKSRFRERKSWRRGI